MLFSSYEFIFIFLPITFFVYFIIGKNNKHWGNIWLVISSLFFYSWWEVINLPLILISIAVNFKIGESLSQRRGAISKRERKHLLIAGVALNLIALGYFKYYDFFIDNLDHLFGISLHKLYLLLPLGISFFTFTQIAYLVDSYRGETKEYNLINYMLFVTFFPHLIAGPIVHHKQLIPQFYNAENRLINYDYLVRGLLLFGLGLFKKLIIADTFSVWAGQGFDQAASLNFWEAWITSFSYTFQLYYDFSAYSDMAVGLALLFNIELPVNFNSPYQSKNIQEFWRRWHITLSKFLKTYLYIVLGGNYKGQIRTYFNLFVTFLLGGLWHGASWMFVSWGALHGLAMVVHRMWSLRGYRMPNWLGWGTTFMFVNITWVFFRAKNIDDAFKVFHGMFDWQSAFDSTIIGTHADKLAWLGAQADYLISGIAGILVINIKEIAAILLCLIMIPYRNSQQLVLQSKEISYCKLGGLGILFGVALVSSLVSTTKVFLYFNF